MCLCLCLPNLCLCLCVSNLCLCLCLPNLCQKEELLETFDSPQGGGIKEHVQSDLPEKFQVSIWMVLPGISIQVEHFSRFHGLTKLLVCWRPTCAPSKHFLHSNPIFRSPGSLRKYWNPNILTKEVLSVPVPTLRRLERLEIHIQRQILSADNFATPSYST